MDIRIVNTCNNNCLYCLEQELRTQQKYISSEVINSAFNWNKDTNVTFYWGNPLLHPELLKIVSTAKSSWYKNIGLLSNTGWLTKEYLKELIDNGLNNFWFYFYSFHPDIHKIYSWWSINLNELWWNIGLLSQSSIYIKCIIHIHKWNLKTLARDIEILHKKFYIMTFEFIDYMLVDRAKKYEKLLSYNMKDYSDSRDIFFEKIKELNVEVKFVRFHKDFFWDFQEYNT